MKVRHARIFISIGYSKHVFNQFKSNMTKDGRINIFFLSCDLLLSKKFRMTLLPWLNITKIGLGALPGLMLDLELLRKI